MESDPAATNKIGLGKINFKKVRIDEIFRK